MVSFRTPKALADRFQEAASAYYGKQSICFSAALLMFLESHPEQQAAFMKRVYDAELADEVETIIEQAVAEQLRRIKAKGDPKPKRTP